MYPNSGWSSVRTCTVITAMDMWASVFGGQHALHTFATWQLHPAYTFGFHFFTITSLSHAVWPQCVSVFRCLNMITHSSLNPLRPRGYFNHYWPNVGLNSIALSVCMSSSNGYIIYCWMLVFHRLLHCNGCFWNSKFRYFLETCTRLLEFVRIMCIASD